MNDEKKKPIRPHTRPKIRRRTQPGGTGGGTGGGGGVVERKLPTENCNEVKKEGHKQLVHPTNTNTTVAHKASPQQGTQSSSSKSTKVSSLLSSCSVDEILEKTRKQLDHALSLDMVQNRKEQSSTATPTIGLLQGILSKANSPSTSSTSSLSYSNSSAVQCSIIDHNSNKKQSKLSPSASQQQQQQQRQQPVVVKGILKQKGKYQNKASGTPHSSISGSAPIPTNQKSKPTTPSTSHSKGGRKASNNTTKGRASPIIKSTIVERPFPKADPYPFPTQPQQKQQQQQQQLNYNSTEIEGYIPTIQTDSKNNKLSVNEPTTNTSIDNNICSDQSSNMKNSINNTKKNEQQEETNINDQNTSAIETDVQFQCMTKSEYKSAVDVSKLLGMSVNEFLSKQKEVIENERKEKESKSNKEQQQQSSSSQYDYENDDNSTTDTETNIEEDDNNDEDDLLSFFAPDSDDEEGDEDSVIIYDPKSQRSFLTLWNALSTWITPQSVFVLQKYRNDLFDFDHDEKYRAVTTAQVDPLLSTDQNNYPSSSDIAISRCEGLMSMMKMNLSKALTDLGYNKSISTATTTTTTTNTITNAATTATAATATATAAATVVDEQIRQMAHSRLAEFIQSFDFSEPMVKFDTKMWYAMSVVLLDILLPSDKEQDEAKKNGEVKDWIMRDLPSSIVAVDVNVEEYYYLTHTAIPTLSKGMVVSDS